MTRREFKAGEKDAGRRLADFLRSRGVSMSYIRSVKYHENGILCNGEHATTARRLTGGDVVSLEVSEERGTTVEPEDIPLDIVYEDGDVMVLEKPAGIAVHPTLNYHDGTVANAYLGLLRSRGETGIFRPVYRLDRNTSGLLVAAKNALAAHWLSLHIQKEYTGVVTGHLRPPCGRVELPIARAQSSVIKRCVSPQGQSAVTEYETLREGPLYSLVKFVLGTGRTHQIRVHMAALGCPLAGDELYGGSTRHAPRQALHCSRVRLLLPGGEPLCLDSPLPGEFLSLLTCEQNDKDV